MFGRFIFPLIMLFLMIFFGGEGVILDRRKCPLKIFVVHVVKLVHLMPQTSRESVSATTHSDIFELLNFEADNFREQSQSFH